MKLNKSVIAEIGINHDGDFEKAKRLILSASKAGCSGIKFQYRNLSRAYAENANEIGDEIILTQIKRTELSSEQLTQLRDYARSLGILAGISFFTVEDIGDFENPILDFDFYKIPSAELMNLSLIETLLKTNKQVYISVGMHTEAEIESIFNEISNAKNWIPMHCISNYPVAEHNSALGYISYLKSKWSRPVGYSSHDEKWENNLIALSLGADIIERHITESVSDIGLDHSSSSTPAEFEKLCSFASSISNVLLGNGPRVPNQGELLNKQNLGRSFYAIRNLAEGEIVTFQDFEYRSPKIGLGVDFFNLNSNAKLAQNIAKGDVLSARHFSKETTEVSKDAIEIASKHKISLPVRLSDYPTISSLLPTGFYEFHLSYKEVASDLGNFNLNADHNYSVHLPDYIDSTTLIDPFSPVEEIKKKSHECIERVIDFAEKIATCTGASVPIVASLAGLNMKREDFYPQVAKLFSTYSTKSAKLTLQWLPPFAWYFGGSIKLGVMNSYEDTKWIRDFNIPVTLDTSHLLLGQNTFDLDPVKLVESIKDHILHWHISDAVGLDGEGMPIGIGGKKNEDFISYVINKTGMKVIEVWQGHFSNFEGFKKEINKIYAMESM